jgi:M6 family metalloprotease-like protein
MKKTFLTFVIFVMVALVMRAVPAWPGAHVVSQPDGTQVTLRLCGDEFYNYWTTEDGYTVVLHDSGWVYATLQGGQLTATTVVAHDAAQRNATEHALLAYTPRGLTATDAVTRSHRALAAAQRPAQTQLFDYSKFRGLIVLVQPKDVEFGHDSPEAARAFYDTMVNTPDFSGFVDHPELGVWTGSVRDYYHDNSMGQFNPNFDIVGPVTVRYNANTFYPHAVSTGWVGGNYADAFWQALTLLDNEIDFSQYDTDDDGTADMVFFLVAGYGSHYGNDPGLLWPHMSYNLSGTSRLDGVRFGLYACSTEMAGLEGQGWIEGIGTICHEFGHVLGLPDLYDTDYAQSGGTSHDPGNWDIMASGNFLNNGRTPAGYSLLERYMLGFAAPQVITSEGDYSLEALGTSNAGYLLPTPIDREYFLLENRQPTKWDAYLPGHGIIVARVDSTRTAPWNNNEVNNDPMHNYYELLRAGNTPSGDLASDPFPGSKGVTLISNFMQPSLQTWDGTLNAYCIRNISEENGVINFNIAREGEEKTVVETFDRLAVTTTAPSEGEGDLASWRLLNCLVESVDGGKAVAMVKPSTVTMSTPVQYTSGRVGLEVHNTASMTAKLRLFYSLDEGATWTTLQTTDGETALEVAPQSKTKGFWNVNFTSQQAVRYRIGMIEGGQNSTNPCRIDNFTIYYVDEATLTGDVTGDGQVDIADVNAVINIMLGKADTTAVADVTGDGQVDIADVNAVINIMLGKTAQTAALDIMRDYVD